MTRIATGGAPWVVAPLALGALLAGTGILLAAPATALVGAAPALLAAGLWWFFRDPERVPSGDLACPADGKVVRIDQVDDPDLGACDRVAIFMRVHDVHVNRVPLDAEVERVTHHPGRHLPAFRKDSHRNEHVETLLHTALGQVKVVQIAGAVARRIVPYLAPGDAVRRGERLGLIRLGSRCDVMVPAGRVAWQVRLGQRVRANTTPLASLVPPTAKAPVTTREQVQATVPDGGSGV